MSVTYSKGALILRSNVYVYYSLTTDDLEGVQRRLGGAPVQRRQRVRIVNQKDVEDARQQIDAAVRRVKKEKDMGILFIKGVVSNTGLSINRHIF